MVATPGTITSTPDFDYVQPNLGTEFIAWVTSMPVSLGFTYWPVAFLYNAAGAVGLIFFYAALEDVTTAAGKSLFTTLLVLVSLLIPSLSFWTSGIGKDSLAFLAVGIFLWSVQAFSRRQIATASAVLIMLPVRPHVAALMVLSVAAGTLFVKESARHRPIWCRRNFRRGCCIRRPTGAPLLRYRTFLIDRRIRQRSSGT